MKSINLKNSEDLKKLQKEMNTVFENRISNAELNESIEKLDSLSFANLKSIFEAITDKLFESKKGKNYIKQYVKTIKENKSLTNYYIISESITHPKNINNASIFLSESMSLNNNINKELFEKGVEKLSKIVKFAICESQISKEDLEKIITDNKNLNESLDYILTNKKTLKNVSEYANHISSLNEYIQKHNIIKEEVEVINAKPLFESLHESFYNNGLENWENKAAIDITLCELANGNKKELFEQYKAECLSHIEKMMETDNIEDKSRFATMKEQLMQKEFSEENLNEDILKLSKLSHTLSE